MSTKASVNDLAARYAEKFGVSKAKAKEAIQNTVETIHDAIVENGGVMFANEFSLEVKERAAREGVNPQTKERTTYPAYNTVKVTVGNGLKTAIQ